MKINFSALSLVVMALLCSSQAIADLVEDNLNTAGDGLITRDTATGLEWLDLAETFGRSYNDVASDSTLTNLGFRHATPAEVESLLRAANVLENPSVADAEAFIGLLSETVSSFPGTDVVSFSGGLHELDPFDSSLIIFTSVFIQDAGGVVSAGTLFNNAASILPKTLAPSFSGNYLVRSAAPTTLLSDLVQQVIELNLSRGIGNAFDSKLQAALDALDRMQADDSPAAVGIMYAFLQSVEAQRGKSLTDEQADELSATANAIIQSIES